MTKNVLLLIELNLSIKLTVLSCSFGFFNFIHFCSLNSLRATTFFTIKNPIVFEKGDFHPGIILSMTTIVPIIKINGINEYKNDFMANPLLVGGQCLDISFIPGSRGSSFELQCYFVVNGHVSIRAGAR